MIREIISLFKKLRFSFRLILFALFQLQNTDFDKYFRHIQHFSSAVRSFDASELK